MKNAILTVLVLVLLLSSCAHPTDIKECVVNSPAGFLSGLWNGFCAPFSFIGSLFSDNISIYDINNNGGWYDFGFVLGSGILTFGSSKTSKIKIKSSRR